jgi:8-hydroxy-5-deazaflavin:NADPH oxidoreductase
MTKRIFTDRSRHTTKLAAGMAMFVLSLGGWPEAGLAQAATPGSGLKIGIVGSGNIGGTLGTLWVKSGHPVLFSSRHPEQLKKLAESLGPLARAGTVREALAFGDVVLVAVPYSAYPQIGKDYAAGFKGKIVIDAGNAVPSRDGTIAKEAAKNGIGVTSAKYLMGARVVRAFNTLNYRTLANGSHRPSGRIAIPIAGDDKDALATVSTLVRSAGFEPVIIGPLVRATDFARGAALYGQEITADEMRRRLKTLR